MLELLGLFSVLGIEPSKFFFRRYFILHSSPHNLLSDLLNCIYKNNFQLVLLSDLISLHRLQLSDLILHSRLILLQLSDLRLISTLQI